MKVKRIRQSVFQGISSAGSMSSFKIPPKLHWPIWFSALICYIAKHVTAKGNLTIDYLVVE